MSGINGNFGGLSSNVNGLIGSYNSASDALDKGMKGFSRAAASGDEGKMMEFQQGIQRSQRIMAAIQEILKMIHQNAMEIIKNLSGR